MPQTPLTEVNIYTANVLAPQPHDDVKSTSVSDGLQALANRTKYLYERRPEVAFVRYNSVLENFTSPFQIGPPNSFSGSTWTDSAMTLTVTGAAQYDDLEIAVWGNWQLNTTSASTTIGEMRLLVTEDSGGTPSDQVVDGIAIISDDSGNVTPPHNEPFMIRATHRIGTAGDATIKLQLRSEDLTGGAGTATLILMFSVRMDVTHCKRS